MTEKSPVPKSRWFDGASPAFRLMVATSWLAPDPWRDRQEESIRSAVAEDISWAEYLRLVDRHRIPALSWAALKRIPGLVIPEHVANELRKRSDICRMQAMLHLQLLGGILKTLNRACIPVMPLKGPLLSEAMYEDAGLRQSKDLDILVARQDIVRTQECLETLGWRRAAEYASLTRRQAEFNLRYEQHVGYVHNQRGCELELHWRTAEDTTADCMARGLSSEWHGCHFLAMAPADLVLYLCNHGSSHAWARAKWLGDMARIWTSQSTDWPAVLRQASTTGQERAVLLCLRLLEDAYGLPTDAGAVISPNLLPAALTAKAVRELTASKEREERGALGTAFEEIRSYGFRRRLWPYKSRWETFTGVALRRVDFNMLRLPDKLFWLYIPLRPFLWAWRHLRDFARNNAFSEKQTPSS